MSSPKEFCVVEIEQSPEYGPKWDCGSPATGNQPKKTIPSRNDQVASQYAKILEAISQEFKPGLLTEEELSAILKVIDNNDYIRKVFPEGQVGWSGLLIDRTIFLAIARFKVQFSSPTLVGIMHVCSRLTTPMPTHMYYLKFRRADGTFMLYSYRSGDEILDVAKNPEELV